MWSSEWMFRIYKSVSRCLSNASANCIFNSFIFICTFFSSLALHAGCSMWPMMSTTVLVQISITLAIGTVHSCSVFWSMNAALKNVLYRLPVFVVQFTLYPRLYKYSVPSVLCYRLWKVFTSSCHPESTSLIFFNRLHSRSIRGWNWTNAFLSVVLIHFYVCLETSTLSWNPSLTLILRNITFVAAQM